MDTINSMLNWIVSPASLVMLAFSWPTLAFINTCEKIYHSFFVEDIGCKVAAKSSNIYTYTIVIDTLIDHDVIETGDVSDINPVKEDAEAFLDELLR
ncbi:hypothetical protein L1987_04237 [Smallanthus sonchifolius]|uniref:Uncharacterized protein n=1 Tax=Smallanthus sonchifolius TaxID=185202 RepID=A0ACB9KCV6_9ASTR|nr:hypothetical protein L1987_04237 [Smallanthus sonchifolius]